MKIGRNDPCPCGSGKKYKRCCIDAVGKQHAEVFDEVEQITAMNPNLTFDEINVAIEHKMHERNNKQNKDFCGLTPDQMANWLYAPFSDLQNVNIQTPKDLSASPVMRYFSLLMDEIINNGGAIKATTKGNLPAKLVNQASDFLPEFAVATYKRDPSISEFCGSNEDKFNALHYTRLLAEIAGFIVLRDNKFHVSKAAQTQYQKHGIQSFFLPLLESAVKQFNWRYFDRFSDEVDLQIFWLFMLWRLQSHASVDQLIEETAVAFPDLLRQFLQADYGTPAQRLTSLIESRFVERFLQFWGFIIMDPKHFINGERIERKVQIQPLLKQTFLFKV